jgi:hypothetical protein
MRPYRRTVDFTLDESIIARTEIILHDLEANTDRIGEVYAFSHCPRNKNICCSNLVLAMKRRHGNCCDFWVDQQEVPFTRRQYGLTAYHGNIRVFQRMLDKDGYERNLEYVANKYNLSFMYARWAAMNGHLDFLKYLYTLQCPIALCASLFAATGGHLDVLKWMYEQRLGLDMDCPAFAAEGGHHEVMDWLLEDDGKRLEFDHPFYGTAAPADPQDDYGHYHITNYGITLKHTLHLSLLKGQMQCVKAILQRISKNLKTDILENAVLLRRLGFQAILKNLLYNFPMIPPLDDFILAVIPDPEFSVIEQERAVMTEVRDRLRETAKIVLSDTVRQEFDFFPDSICRYLYDDCTIANCNTCSWWLNCYEHTRDALLEVCFFLGPDCVYIITEMVCEDFDPVLHESFVLEYQQRQNVPIVEREVYSVVHKKRRFMRVLDTNARTPPELVCHDEDGDVVLDSEEDE